MKIDYHIHSEFSADSSADMNSIIRKAIKRKYAEIAFTDHFDLLPTEIAIYGTPSYLRYSEAIMEMQQRYPSISILKGVELGEYHHAYQLADRIMELCDPPDLKIASIHILPDGSNVSEPFEEELCRESIELYYRENLELVSYGNFDILGHLGIYKRYLEKEPDESSSLEIIKEIFRKMIDQRIALEVNLSGLRNSLKHLIPSVEYLKIYRELGGELITIGSDSHRVEHFDVDYDRVVKELSACGFSYIARKKESDWEMINISGQ